VDSIHGPTKNNWQSGEKYTLFENVGESATSIEQVQECNSTRGTKMVCRELHQLSSCSSTEGSSSPTEHSDWFIAGGSSGGSAVAVASGTVFA
jgi:Asp-tRNA(Asn)/Glu-tRNA(Gln) amidotransferase A subunit family amidase